MTRRTSPLGRPSVGLLLAVLLSGRAGAASPGVSNGLPTGWQTANIGNYASTGEVEYDSSSGAFTLRTTAESGELSSTFAYTEKTGDFAMICRVTGSSSNIAPAGIMLRASLAHDSRYAICAFNGIKYGNGPACVLRAADGTPPFQPGDLGVLRGNGSQTTQRSYWNNLSTAIVSDIPSEARLDPANWGLPDQVVVNAAYALCMGRGHP